MTPTPDDRERSTGAIPDDREDAGELFGVLFDELRSLARAYMSAERGSHTLQPTALVHEAYLRLSDAGTRFESREHFLNAAARTMRRILVDHARTSRAEKRTGSRRGRPLDAVLTVVEERTVDILALNEALDELASEDPELAHLVELRFFAGATEDEVARIQSVSRRTVTRGWNFARRWLKQRLDSADG